jgi:hypothetical protein
MGYGYQKMLGHKLASFEFRKGPASVSIGAEGVDGIVYVRGISVVKDESLHPMIDVRHTER